MAAPKPVLEAVLQSAEAPAVVAEANAANVVPAVARAQLVHPDHPDSPETQVHQEHPDSLDDRNKRHANKQHSHHADHAPADNLASLDHQDRPDNPELQANRALVVETHNLDRQDRLAHLDSLEDLVNPVDLDSPDNRLNLNKEGRHLLAHQERLDSPDSPETQDRQANPADPANPDRRDHPARLDNPETTDHPDSPVNLDRPEAEARRAFARNIAPSTVACSSRMALAGVKQQRSKQQRVVRRTHNVMQSVIATIKIRVFSSFTYLVPVAFLALLDCHHHHHQNALPSFCHIQ